MAEVGISKVFMYTRNGGFTHFITWYKDWSLRIPVHLEKDMKNIKSDMYMTAGEMVFCYQNCSDLLWEKIAIQEKLLKFEAEGQNLQKKFWSLEQKWVS